MAKDLWARGSRMEEVAAQEPRLHYLGRLPYRDVPGVLARALVGLAPVENVGGRADTGMAPVKVFEMLSSGVPVVVTDLGFQANLVSKHQCGRVVSPNEVWLVVCGAKGKSTIFKDVSFRSLPARVHFTGHVPDEYLPALYSGAIAFVYPSLYEGFGFPPLEAMACGTPSVTGNRTSLPEVVGDAGLMVDPYDAEALAEGIRQLVENENLRDELRAKGIDRAKKFTWERTAHATQRVLQQEAY